MLKGESATLIVTDDFSLWDTEQEPDRIDFATTRIYECPRCGGLADEIWDIYGEGTYISCGSCEMMFWWDEDGRFCWRDGWPASWQKRKNGSYSVEMCSRHQSEGLLVVLWDEKL